MWDVDEMTEAPLLQRLQKRLPGVEYYDIEDLVRGTYWDNPGFALEQAEKPWYVFSGNKNDEHFISGADTKEDLYRYVLEDLVAGNIIDIFHDGVQVKWSLQLVIEE